MDTDGYGSGYADNFGSGSKQYVHEYGAWYLCHKGAWGPGHSMDFPATLCFSDCVYEMKMYVF